MRTNLLTLVGFVLLMYGLITLVLSISGLNFTYMTWLDSMGPLVGFILRLLMVISGVIIVVLAQVDWAREIQENQ